MHIDYLAEHMEHLPVLAKWFHDQWGYLSPGYTLEERTRRLLTRANREGVPITFIAMDGDEPIGSASLVESDLTIRPQLKPWLSSVYVETSSRKRGVGTALVSRVIHEAQEQGISTLYLWTPSEEAFYSRRGWNVIERTTYKDENAIIMTYATRHAHPTR